MDNLTEKISQEPAEETTPVSDNNGNAENRPDNFMTKDAWLKSLLLPGLSIVISLAGMFFLKFNGTEAPFMKFAVIFGLVLGGIVPTVMILWNGIDTSEYFVGKMIFLSLLLTFNGYYPILLLLFSGGYIGGYIAEFVLLGGGTLLIGLTVSHSSPKSEHFAGKMIWLAVTAVGVILNFTPVIFDNFPMGGSNQFFVTVVILIAEIVFSFVQKTDFKTKICLALSSLSYGYLGFLIGYAEYSARSITATLVIGG